MIILNKNQRGVGAIKLLFFVPLVLIGLVVLIYIYTELNKAYWDREVKALCEKDGGVTVYEVVNLTKDEYLQNEGKNGLIRVMSRRTSKKEHQYAFVSKTNVINAKNPYVRRTEYVTYRKSDNKQLGLWVTYSRRGGDFPTGISHPSSFSCRDIQNFEQNINAHIFIYQGE